MRQRGLGWNMQRHDGMELQTGEPQFFVFLSEEVDIMGATSHGRRLAPGIATDAITSRSFCRGDRTTTPGEDTRRRFPCTL